MVRLVDLRMAFRAGETRFTLLDVPSLILSTGGSFGLSGPSGSGKSTLLNILAGLLRPSSGRVWVDGVDITTLSQRQLDSFRAERIGYVFQSFNLIPALNAFDNVALAMSFSGRIPARTQQARASALLERVGLANRARHKPAALSHGQMQRVSIARAIANRPRLILADEPTASLEPGLAGSIMDLLIELVGEIGATLLVASHNADILDRLAEVIALPA